MNPIGGTQSAPCSYKYQYVFQTKGYVMLVILFIHNLSAYANETLKCVSKVAIVSVSNLGTCALSFIGVVHERLYSTFGANTPKLILHTFRQHRQEDWGGPGQIQKVGPHKIYSVGGSGGVPPGNFENLHAVKCVLGGPEALCRPCTQYIYTCKLLSSISGFRSKSTTYALTYSTLFCCVVVCE